MYGALDSGRGGALDLVAASPLALDQAMAAEHGVNGTDGGALELRIALSGMTQTGLVGFVNGQVRAGILSNFRRNVLYTSCTLRGYALTGRAMAMMNKKRPRRCRGGRSGGRKMRPNG